MRIAVAGATGLVGRLLVGVLEAEGHQVVAISRSADVDAVTGEGLAEAPRRLRSGSRWPARCP